MNAKKFWTKKKVKGVKILGHSFKSGQDYGSICVEWSTSGGSFDRWVRISKLFNDLEDMFESNVQCFCNGR